MIESKGYKITPIDGDLAVSRNAEVGGDADIHGKARVAGSLKVDGFLDAPHIKGAAKGLFTSLEELNREFPNPRPGWFAIVLDATDKTKGVLYKAENKAWVATTNEAKPYEFIKDSINVFASKGELADETERAQGVEGTLRTAIDTNATDLAETKKNIANQLLVDSTADKVTITGRNEQSMRINFESDIPAATTEKAGVISAEDKRKLTKPITWNNDTDPSNMNDFTIAGVYDIKGEHKRVDDNLPILNTGGVHSFNARLTVLDSSISGSGEDDDMCITQVLSFSNRLGQGEIYIRTGKGGSLDNLTWEKWSTLQRNVNVGEVGSLDDLKDNGIYSGVWLFGSLNTYPLAFVCIVINDYFIGTAPRRISQFVYGLSKFDGSVVYQYRVWDDSKDKWSDWEILNQKEISSMIDNAIKGIIADAPEAFDTFKEIAEYIAEDGATAAEIIKNVAANAQGIADEITRAKAAEEELEEKIAEETERATLAEDELGTAAVKEKEALKNGDTIVGLAREIYSRTGKTDKATFLQRTTAGGTSISDGVASVKQIGGNIVKNCVDGIDVEKWYARGGKVRKVYEGVFGFLRNNGTTEGALSFGPGVLLDNKFSIKGHKYYYSCSIKADMENSSDVVKLGVLNSAGAGNTGVLAKNTDKWQSLSCLGTSEASSSYYAYILYDRRPIERANEILVKDFLCIDLTEMYGAGNEPTKEECDKMYGTMPALPQGITIAQPTGLKSTGYNQWNPQNIIEDTYINDNALEDNSARDIAVVECVPCAVGAGENNGYVIGYGEGDTWSDEGIEVYFTPLNPIGTEDELYLDKLEKDSTYGTYVPMANGYLLVVTPTTDKLCAHLRWSGDRAKTDYEEYIESNVAIPAIPQMSEWGLAGIHSSGTLAADTIDLERMVYTKRIGTLDLGTLYFRASAKAGVYYAALGNDGNTEYSLTKNVISPDYGYSTSAVVYNATSNKTIFVGTSGYFVSNRQVIAVCDTTIENGTGIGNIRGILYYELESPEEYPIVTKTAPNYIGSDYGVEKWMGSRIPLSANILFYMRSLVGETRNFLDQLYTNTERFDAKEVADYITNGIEENSKKADDAVTLALRKLYIAAGATYNESTGYYTVGDLDDITEEDMAKIYAGKEHINNLDKSKALAGSVKFRTMIPTMSSSAGQVYTLENPINGDTLCSGNTLLEIFKLANAQVLSDVQYTSTIPFISSRMNQTFYNCTNLKVIFPIHLSLVNYTNKPFAGCSNLVEVRLYNIKISMSFSDSPLISKDSIIWMLKYAVPTSAITITLHADAYARLKDDADIVAALAAQPLITIVSA